MSILPAADRAALAGLGAPIVAHLADARREVERVYAASGDAIVATQSLRADNGRAIVTHSTPNRAQRRAKARR